MHRSKYFYFFLTPFTWGDLLGQKAKELVGGYKGLFIEKILN